MTCKAEQMSDQMVCVCGNVWDVNDTTPPACRGSWRTNNRQEIHLRFTEEQWNALCVLRHIDGAKRQASPSTKALREVLVDGVPPTDAAKAHGLTHQAVYHSLSRSRAVQALARELAGASDI